MKKVGILGAMDCEVEGLRTLLCDAQPKKLCAWDLTEGFVGAHSVFLVRSGVGKVLSSAVTQALICEHQPDILIFTGIAGAIDPKLQIGDVVVATDCIQHDMNATGIGFPHGEIPYTGIREVMCDDALRKLALSWVAPDGVKVIGGRVLSGDQFITGNRTHHPHLDDLAGAVVEMEGAAFATVAQLNRVPSCIIRTVSDNADGHSRVAFEEFMEIATKHSVEVVRHVLAHI